MRVRGEERKGQVQREVTHRHKSESTKKKENEVDTQDWSESKIGSQEREGKTDKMEGLEDLEGVSFKFI